MRHASNSNFGSEFQIFGFECSSNVETASRCTCLTSPVRRPAGVVDGFWEFRLKPWDVSAGVLIAREAGAKVTTMDGGPFSAFSRSLLVSNGHLHDQILQQTGPAVESLVKKDIDLSPWYVPSGYSFEEV